MDAAEVDLLAGNPWVMRRKITVAEYHEMGKAGILREDDRVELIEGELVAKAPIGSEHNGGTNWLTQALVRAVGERAIVQVQGSIRLDEQTEPQPDISVLLPRADFYRKTLATPADVLLLIEIADSSLRFDRAVKRPLYARAGIAEYWIVDLTGQAVEVCRSPNEHGYGSVVRLGRDKTLSLESLPDVTISVAELLG